MQFSRYTNKLIAAFAVLSAVTGCTQNRPSESVLKQHLIGRWKVDSYREVTTLNGTVNNDQTQPVNGTVEFKTNGQVISVDEAGNAEEGTWSLMDGGKRVKILFNDLASAGLHLPGFLGGETFELQEVNAENLALSNRSSLAAGKELVKYELTFNLAR